MPPKLDEKRAIFVLDKIDQIMAWEREAHNERDTKFVDLGRYLCEVRAGQYWRAENATSFDDFLERRFPGSRRKAYYLMSIHENLPKQIRKDLKQIGWTKARDLAKLARRQGQAFESAPWVHKARELPRQEFHDEIERVLNGGSEASDLMYFRVFRSQVPVIEQALDVAARMLGSDRSRGYCLEMICADFLAGAHADGSTPEVLLFSMFRLFNLLPHAQQRRFLQQVAEMQVA